MNWEIINIPQQPKCDFCGSNTIQMARFNAPIRSPSYPIYICSLCARYVKDCMNKWDGLKPKDYIEPDILGSEYCGWDHEPDTNESHIDRPTSLREDPPV